ncbi:hypothetical protein ACG9XW_22370 [Acinetobacter guillouiae]|uniref:hypothetical protein n=1 Tax=Acinetobacter guillouiae TaxID=106649 RepID=UPI003AF56D38
MKSLLFLVFSLIISSSAFAGISTTAVRTSSGQLVSVGDSLTEMSTRIGQSPISMNTYERKEGKTTVTVSNYIYEIENVTYTFTVVNNQIREIEWIRKEP